MIGFLGLNLKGSIIELVEIIVIILCIISVIILILRFLKSRNISLSTKNIQVESSINKTTKFSYYEKIYKLYDLRTYEVIRRQMNFADMKGREIIDVMTETYKNELNLYDNHLGDYSPTKIEDYKNYQLLQTTFYQKMQDLFKTYFKENGFEQYLLTTDTYKNIDIEKRFCDYKKTRIDNILVMGSQHSDILYTGHYISRKKLTEIIRNKCGGIISKCISDIFDYSRKVYKEVYDEMLLLEKELEEIDDSNNQRIFK